jgi:hypothetical protein
LLAGGEARERVVSAGTAGAIMNEQARSNTGEHLTADHTVSDLINHPASPASAVCSCLGTTAPVMATCGFDMSKHAAI